jgi:hypothetical protein
MRIFTPSHPRLRDEVITLANQAAALQVYAKQAKHGMVAQNLSLLTQASLGLPQIDDTDVVCSRHR